MAPELNQNNSADADGRRERARNNKSRILTAYRELIRSGNTRPMSTEVAEAAGVGLRSVFRHFDDMESLFSILVDEVEATIHAELTRPYLSREWQGRAFETVARRADIFEKTMPVLVALEHRRHESARARLHGDWMQHIEHAGWAEILPMTIKANIPVFSGLELTTGSAAWLRLRNEMQLSPADALDTQQKLIARLLGPR